MQLIDLITKHIEHKLTRDDVTAYIQTNQLTNEKVIKLKSLIPDTGKQQLIQPLYHWFKHYKQVLLDIYLPSSIVVIVLIISLLKKYKYRKIK